MKYFIQLFCIVTLISSCKQEKATKNTISHQKEVEQLGDNAFRAIPMPTTLVTNTPFPTDSVIINNWVANSKAVNNLETNSDIINHGWAIWKALTDITNQEYNNQKLRRFETWYTPNDIINAYKMRKKVGPVSLMQVQRSLGSLEQFNQIHGKDITPSENSVLGFVKYDPTAAKHIYDNNLFYESTLNKMLKTNQISKIPDFPLSGVVIKPVFTVLNSIDKDTNLYSIPAWPGNQNNPKRPFSPDSWNNSVGITITGETNVSKRIYSVNDFIHFKLDSAQASKKGAKKGDYAVLLGMHVTTREIKRWTWQTFWWSEFSDNPNSPSSKTIAKLRNSKKLDHAASKYAMAIAYNMVQPAQPYTKGTGKEATSLYVYNPYLEAGFGTSVFKSANDTIRKYYSKNYQKVGNTFNEYGMQTNCMSCHGQARYIKGLSGRKGHLYVTDQYFDLNSPYFKNTVKLDFTWSIQGNLIDDN